MSCVMTAEEVRTISKTGFFSFGRISQRQDQTSHTMYSRMAAAKVGSEAIVVGRLLVVVVRVVLVVVCDCAEGVVCAVMVPESELVSSVVVEKKNQHQRC